MAKGFLTMLMSYSIFMGCAQSVQNHIKKIEFVSTARGYFFKQDFTPDSVTTINQNSATRKRPIQKEEWNNLVHALQNVELSAIPTLKSPTMKRAYDGARHSTLYITTHDGQTWTHAFDDEDPHQQLHKLMKAIGQIQNR